MLDTPKRVNTHWRYLLLGAIALPVFGGLYYGWIDYFLFG
jgi:hypothetical protein